MFGLNRRTRWPASERRLRERAERVSTLRRSVNVPRRRQTLPHYLVECISRSACADVIPPTPAQAGTVRAELLVGQGAYQCN